MILDEYLNYLNEVHPSVLIAPLIAAGAAVAIKRHKKNVLIDKHIDPNCVGKCEGNYNKTVTELSKQWRIAEEKKDKKEMDKLVTLAAKVQYDRDTCIDKCRKEALQRANRENNR
jgi:hypothetical protein